MNKYLDRLNEVREEIPVLETLLKKVKQKKFNKPQPVKKKVKKTKKRFLKARKKRISNKKRKSKSTKKSSKKK